MKIGERYWAWLIFYSTNADKTYEKGGIMKRLNNKGQNTLEYVLMLGFVAAIIVLFFTLFKGQFKNMVDAVTGKIQSAISQMGQ